MKKAAKIFKALSDETRLRILSLLTVGEICVCDLMATLKLPQSTVSRHLAYLKNVNLVEDRRVGVWMYYRLITDDALIQTMLGDLPLKLAQMESNLNDHKVLQEHLSMRALKAEQGDK